MSVLPVWMFLYTNQLWTVLFMSFRAKRLNLSFQPNPKLALDTEDISRSLAREMPPEWTARDIHTLGLGGNPLESKASLCDTRALAWVHRSRFDTRVRERILTQCLDDLRPWDQASLTCALTAEAYGSSATAFLQRLRHGDWRPSGPDWWVSSDMYMRMGIRAYTMASHANAYLSGGEGLVTRYDILLLLDFVRWRCSKSVVEEEYWRFLVSTLELAYESPEEAARIYDSLLDLVEHRPTIVHDVG